VFLAGDALVEIVRTHAAYRRGDARSAHPGDAPDPDPAVGPERDSGEVDPARD
jgi:hypothetical protein